MIKKVLTIAGSDCSGGAGLQADLKTFTSLGVYGMSVVTALTAQNTTSVSAIHVPDVDFLAKQIDAVFTDIQPDSIKLGMLANSEVVAMVAKKLKEHRGKNIIVDPVMISSTGAQLLEEEAVEIVKNELFPIAGLITPNLHEAAFLLGKEIPQTKDQMLELAKQLSVLTPNAVLLKGGHLSNSRLSPDLLIQGDEHHWFETEMVPTKNTHGTGCTLSAAIAAYLAIEDDLKLAIEKAKDFVWKGLKGADKLEVGKGFGPLNHLPSYHS